MLKYRLILLFAIVIGTAHAQFVESEKEAALRTGSTDNVLPKLILRTNITGLWETLPNVNLAAEYHLFSILSAELEYAHIGPWVPHGLGISGELLFVAEAYEGIKVFDISNPEEPIQIGHHREIHVVDVIFHRGLLIATGRDGVHQFDYTNPADLQLVSTLTY